MPSNIEYQAQIARTLVADGDVRAALDFCTENRWRGVAQAIANLRWKEAKDHAATPQL